MTGTFWKSLGKSVEDVEQVQALLPGGEAYEFYACFTRPDPGAVHRLLSTIEAAQHCASAWGDKAVPAIQVRVDWSSGAEYRSPWIFLECNHHEEPCSYCGVMISSNHE